MYDFSALTLGIVSTHRDTFPPVKNAVANNTVMMQRIHSIVDALPGVTAVYAEDVAPGGLICYPEETNKVTEYFKEKKVDAILMLHANFGQEEAVGRLCHALQVPVLLWGPRDGAKDSNEGFRDTDTQCGMFASSRALLRWGVKFTYAENCWLDSPILEREIEKFCRVASVIKTFRSMSVLQISNRPRQFLSVKVNESELMEKFGFQITTIETTIMKRAYDKTLAEKTKEIDALLEKLDAGYNLSSMSEDGRRRLGAAVLTIWDLAEQYGCNVVASECWSSPDFIMGMQPCLAFAILEDMGLTVSCECDINGAISAALARAATRGDSAVFFADVTARHPFNDNAELMWHCGRYPASLSREEKPAGNMDGRIYHELKPGDITMFRFDGTRGKYYLFADEGRGVDGPYSQGAYVWLEVEDWPKWERRLMYGPYIHHMAGVYGKYKDVIREACRYLDVTFDCADMEREYE